jgi:hypothetical protein
VLIEVRRRGPSPMGLSCCARVLRVTESGGHRELGTRRCVCKRTDNDVVKLHSVAYPAKARHLAQRAVPGLMADRARRYERGLREREGVTAIARELVGSRPMEVRDGLFTGMKYPGNRVADVGAPVAKLYGTYEQEISYVFTAALARGVRTFIDVGCADGYYAVGMPYLDYRITSHAFDISRSARDLCREVARANALEEEVRIATRFSERSLDSIEPAGALMLCDIEGAELDLFDARLIRRLAHTTVIIEVHEHVKLGLSATLRIRFAASHDVTVVGQTPREPGRDLPLIAFNEHRPASMHWLVCAPLSASALT